MFAKTLALLKGVIGCQLSVRKKAAPLAPLAKNAGNFDGFEEAHVALVAPLAKYTRFLMVFKRDSLPPLRLLEERGSEVSDRRTEGRESMHTLQK